jgi:hypothetical protein
VPGRLREADSSTCADTYSLEERLLTLDDRCTLSIAQRQQAGAAHRHQPLPSLSCPRSSPAQSHAYRVFGCKKLDATARLPGRVPTKRKSGRN